MNKSTKRQLSKENLHFAAKVLKAIAHPVKLEILEVLETEQPLDVSTICNRIGASCEISMMSHHLAKMKDNGILMSEKVGKQVFYSIKNKQILKIFDCIKNCEIM